MGDGAEEAAGQSEGLKKEFEKLSAAVSAYQQAVTDARRTNADLIKDFGDASASARGFLKTQEALQRRNALAAVESRDCRHCAGVRSAERCDR